MPRPGDASSHGPGLVVMTRSETRREEGLTLGLK